MAFFDFPEDQLRSYTGAATKPDDFESFWLSTLEEQPTDLDVQVEKVEFPVAAYEVFDVSFLGYGGARIHSWVRVPRGEGPRPTVLHFIGYSGSRGYPWKEDWFGEAGYIHATMDSRSQGWRTRNFGPTTDDLDLARGFTAQPGLMTSGVLDRDTYYYRRIFVDTIRFLQALLTLDIVDPDKVVVTGASQGGGLALALTGLAALVKIPLAGSMVDVPFMCDFPRAVGLTDDEPYNEIREYLRYNPQLTDQVFTTLAYFDGVNFARLADAPALFSTGLMDTTCPPSTVFAAYNTYAHTDKDIEVWRWNGHEGGQEHMVLKQLSWLQARVG